MTDINKKVLIVEDELDLREALATAFLYEGFLTLTAEDGEAGFTTALSGKPDIILMDVLMPKMDGLEVLKKLRELDATKNIPVIIMTALDDLTKVQELIKTDLEEYVMKSDISLSKIVEKVKGKLGIQ